MVITATVNKVYEERLNLLWEQDINKLDIQVLKRNEKGIYDILERINYLEYKLYLPKESLSVYMRRSNYNKTKVDEVLELLRILYTNRIKGVYNIKNFTLDDYVSAYKVLLKDLILLSFIKDVVVYLEIVEEDKKLANYRNDIIEIENEILLAILIMKDKNYNVDR